MGAIRDRLDLGLEEVKKYLRVDDDHDDVLIEALIESTKEFADEFCNNPFTKADGDEQPIPAAIKVWCLKRIARNYERRAEGMAYDQAIGAGSISWGDPEYAELWPYRRLPGL